jgi:hypothetical protein
MRIAATKRDWLYTIALCAAVIFGAATLAVGVTVLISSKY